MSVEYDEKGKHYTNVISKIPVPSIIQTTANLIRGLVHVNQTGVSNGKVLGEIQPTGIRPNFTPWLEAAGFKLGAEIFMAKPQPPAQRR